MTQFPPMTQLPHLSNEDQSICIIGMSSGRNVIKVKMSYTGKRALGEVSDQQITTTM